MLVRIMRHTSVLLIALARRAAAAGHVEEKSGGLMWPCDGGWACGYNACIPASTCMHARAVLLAKMGERAAVSCACAEDDPGISMCAVEVDVLGCTGKPKADQITYHLDEAIFGLEVASLCTSI